MKDRQPQQRHVYREYQDQPTNEPRVSSSRRSSCDFTRATTSKGFLTVLVSILSSPVRAGPSGCVALVASLLAPLLNRANRGQDLTARFLPPPRLTAMQACRSPTLYPSAAASNSCPRHESSAIRYRPGCTYEPIRQRRSMIGKIHGQRPFVLSRWSIMTVTSLSYNHEHRHLVCQCMSWRLRGRLNQARCGRTKYRNVKMPRIFKISFHTQGLNRMSTTIMTDYNR